MESSPTTPKKSKGFFRFFLGKKSKNAGSLTKKKPTDSNEKKKSKLKPQRSASQLSEISKDTPLKSATPPPDPHPTAPLALPLALPRDLTHLRHSWPRLRAAADALREELQLQRPSDSQGDLISNSQEISLTDIEWGPQLAEGFYGRIYFVRHRRTRCPLVLKENKDQHENREQFLREVEVLKSLAHPHVLHFVAIFTHDNCLALVVEYIGGGSLEQLLADYRDTPDDLPWWTRIRMGLDVAEGLAYIHSKGIIHRDIKPENCMLRPVEHSVVIVDFGLARPLQGRVVQKHKKSASIDVSKSRTLNYDPRHILSDYAEPDESPLCTAPPTPGSGTRPRRHLMSVVGTPYWMAPEVLSSLYDCAADVFSYGILLGGLITLLSADPDIMPRTEDFGVDHSAFWALSPSCPPALMDACFECANANPAERPTMADIESRLRGLLMKMDSQSSSSPSTARKAWKPKRPSASFSVDPSSSSASQLFSGPPSHLSSDMSRPRSLRTPENVSKDRISPFLTPPRSNSPLSTLSTTPPPFLDLSRDALPLDQLTSVSVSIDYEVKHT